jgi:hypothetical protein
MGYKANTYKVMDALNYVPVFGTIGTKVLVVDRNGIGVKHTVNFATGATPTATSTFSWYGVKLVTLSINQWILTITNSVMSGQRTIVYEIGSVVVAGRTYAVLYGNQIAKYTAQSGDTATSVRNGLKSAIDAVSWTGFTVTTTSVSTNRLQLVINNVNVNFTTYLGQQKWKKGRYATISGVIYILEYIESTTTEPALPALAASYQFANLNTAPLGLESYLDEPLTGRVFSTGNGATTDIIAFAGTINVPANECVVSEALQRIYFSDTLGLGEVIKVFQK